MNIKYISDVLYQFNLEPVCSKKRTKIVPDQLLVPVTELGNKGPLKVMNGTKLILDDLRNNLDSFPLLT